MSVWRIDKVDAQTRALAEAAAKSAGMPLGAWLERAIMRRIESKTSAQAPFVAPPIEAAVEEPAAAPEISTEMQAALEAAQRRRRKRSSNAAKDSAPSSGNPAAEPADPFATPEKEIEESPFEQASPVDLDSPAEPVAKLEDDVPVIAADKDEVATSDILFPNGAADNVIEDIVERARPAALLEDSAQAASGPALVPGLRPDLEDVVTTPRQSVLAAETSKQAHWRMPSSLLLIGIGLVLALAIGGGAYFYMVEPQTGRSATTATAPPVAAKPTEQAAAPTPAPAPQPAAPAPPVAPAPAASATQAPTSAAAAVPPPPATSEPTRAPAPPPRTMGPSMANLAAVDPPPPAPQPSATPAAAAPEPAAAAARPAIANEALPALRTQAEAGDLEAQVELARRYIQGLGVGRNEVEAGKWLLRAADQGHAQAQFNVGVMYERGVGLEANLSKAIEYYRKSAAQSTPMAMHNLGLLYASDQPGMRADPAQARRLLTQAAELGQAESQYSLALMHLQGVGGPVDRVAALSWMVVSARPNQPQVIEQARQLAVQLSQPERDRAQQMAEGHIRRIQSNLQKQRNQPQAAIATEAPASTRASLATPAAKPRVIDRAAIMEMQKLLATLKIYSGTADGTMGPRTAAAIKEFQAMAGMPVDGKPSAELLDNLNEVAGLTKQ